MFLELNDESRDLLLRSEHLYARAKVSREVLRQISRLYHQRGRQVRGHEHRDRQSLASAPVPPRRQE